jgi:hypothetical protein
MMLYRVLVNDMCDACEEYTADTYKWFETKVEAEAFEQLIKVSKWKLPATHGIEGVSVPESPAGLVAWLNAHVMGPK